MLSNSARTAPSLLLAALFAAPLLLVSPVAGAAEKDKTPAPRATVKVASTPQEHMAKAEEYKTKAAAYRAEAALHRKMLETYYVEHNDSERPDEDPYVKKMRIHCEGFINKAEALATEAENFADFHRMWAESLKGK